MLYSYCYFMRAAVAAAASMGKAGAVPAQAARPLLHKLGRLLAEVGGRREERLEEQSVRLAEVFELVSAQALE